MENINKEIKTQIEEIIYKTQDFNDMCEKIDYTINSSGWKIVEEIRSVLYEYTKIKEELVEISKQLKKLNGEKIDVDDELPF